MDAFEVALKGVPYFKVGIKVRITYVDAVAGALLELQIMNKGVVVLVIKRGHSGKRGEEGTKKEKREALETAVTHLLTPTNALHFS